MSAFYSETIGQKIPDTVVKNFMAAKTRIEGHQVIFNYVYSIRNDTAFFTKASEMLNYISSKNDQVLIDYVQLSINDQLARTGDYITAITSSLDILRRFEKLQDRHGIMATYRVLSAAYFLFWRQRKRCGIREKSSGNGKGN